ncbi:transglutaminase-like N-terminal region [Rhizobium sp. NFR07]|nr:transglutaminase-like N-terminal region [Rhizobium sp. NFR07]
MPTLNIHHRTTYVFQEKVSLSPHRLMLRPREGRELRLLSHEISMSTEAQLTWSTDVFGNAIASATFQTPSESLVVDSMATVDLTASAWPVFDIAASAINYPFLYSDNDWTDLGALTVQQYEDVEQRLARWARGFVARRPTDTLSLLKDISLGIASSIAYQSREEEGTQSPLTTLDRGWGSCRDLPYYSWRRCAAWASAPGSSRAICSTRTVHSPVRWTMDQPMLGLKYSFRALAGSHSIRRTAAWAAPTSSQSP